jgi:hypothetical protein
VSLIEDILQVSRALRVTSESKTWLGLAIAASRFGIGYQMLGPSEQLTSIRLEPRVIKFRRFHANMHGLFFCLTFLCLYCWILCR